MKETLVDYIYNDDALSALQSMRDGSVDCIVTSPPYYGLRDYGTGKWEGGDPNCPHKRLSKWSDKMQTGHKQAELIGMVGDGIYKNVCPLCGAVRVDKQIGLEETPEQFIEKLTEVFRECRRVLKDEGTMWVNIGDSYWGSGSRGYDFTGKFTEVSEVQAGSKGTIDLSNIPKLVGNKDGYKNKDLIGIPWMLAFALRNDGWYLRQDIIWCISGGAHVYAKTQKGVMPMMVKDLVRLNPSTVQLWNGQEWVNVLGFGESNDKSERLEIVLRSGERIGATGKHKWVLSDGKEVMTKDLKIGDILASCDLPDADEHKPTCMTRDALWMLGLYIAEGSKSDDCIQISLNADEVYMIPRIREAIEHFGGTVTHTVMGNNLQVRIYSQVFNAVLHQYVGGHTAKDKHLNNIVWSMKNDMLAEIMRGYFDGDGHEEQGRIRLGFTRNYYWERDLRTMAARLGATITLKPCMSKIGDKPYPSFRGEWRWNRSGHWNEKDRCEIVEIRRSRARHFYDISVDCDNHLYSLASGVLTHNCKPNPMPESVRDRCTKSHEYIFLLSKKTKYFFDAEAIKEKTSAKEDLAQDVGLLNQSDETDAKHAGGTAHGNYVYRNKRDVWEVSASSFKGAHFATYPKELISPCITAGCPKGGIVLDPFFGSGTTGVVAIENGRHFVGIELNPEYVKIAQDRIDTTAYQASLFDCFEEDEGENDKAV